MPSDDNEIIVLTRQLERGDSLLTSLLLTHWGRVAHIYAYIVRRQAIIWTYDAILLIGTLGTNLSAILSEIYIFSYKKMRLKMLSAK